MPALHLPHISILDSAAAEMLSGADKAQGNAINKALYHLHSGLAIVPTAGGFLVPSGTRGGVIHRISTVHGCGCEAGQRGIPCWHAKAIAIIEEAQRHTMPKLTPARPVVKPAETSHTAPIGFRKALADMNELF